MRDKRLYLKDIRDAIESIFSFVGTMTFSEFSSDDKTSSAVLRKLEIIGEAVKGLPNDLRKAHSSIPWREMAGMRDRLIHAYFGVDHQLVWVAIKDRLPEVLVAIRDILSTIDQD